MIKTVSGVLTELFPVRNGDDFLDFFLSHELATLAFRSFLSNLILLIAMCVPPFPPAPPPPFLKEKAYK